MQELSRFKSDAEKAAGIVLDAGGEVVGRTRLQKMAYLLEIAGLGSDFVFEYRHYGPYSEELAVGVANANLQNLISQEDRLANWGGSYSIFKVVDAKAKANVEPSRRQMLELTVKANPVALELAATAAYLAIEGDSSPWVETQRRKPEKAEKFLDSAKVLYQHLRSIATPTPLPEIQN